MLFDHATLNISIHALHEESDWRSNNYIATLAHFNPRSP